MQYVAVTPLGGAISIGLVLLVVVALYRRIGGIEKLANVFFVIMLAAVGAVVVAAYTHFDPRLAFTFPKGAFAWPWQSLGEFYRATQTVASDSSTPPPVGVAGVFYIGLGWALMNAIYDYAGYNTTAYMGAELKDPGRVIPRSIVYSILGMMTIYLLLQIGVLGVVPWERIAVSDSIGSVVLEQTWGIWPARIFTALIVITAFASIVMGLLGGSRVPYNAAKDRLFFPVFGRLHPQFDFPHVALLVMAVVMGVGSLFSLGNVIAMLTAVMVLVQAIAQIAALTVLRKRQPTLRRPYRMWLYPVPSLIALIGWLVVYYSSGWTPILLSLGWFAAGVIAFLIWAAVEKTWPFGPKEIREEFIEAQRAPAVAGAAHE
jgi:amino acid transporter